MSVFMPLPLHFSLVGLQNAPSGMLCLVTELQFLGKLCRQADLLRFTAFLN